MHALTHTHSHSLSLTHPSSEGDLWFCAELFGPIFLVASVLKVVKCVGCFSCACSVILG
uniref:Uncharacterized protein n=1 Tax=Anguilla anguilla TaxID=7936 RepID=A0A0E9VDU4_ANGAN